MQMVLELFQTEMSLMSMLRLNQNSKVVVCKAKTSSKRGAADNGYSNFYLLAVSHRECKCVFQRLQSQKQSNSPHLGEAGTQERN